MSKRKSIFKAALEASGMIQTEKDLKIKFNAMAEAENISVNNQSAFSPFWNLLTSIAVTPFLWLQNFLVSEVMPNQFIATASGEFLDVLGDGYGLTRKTATMAVFTLNLTAEENFILEVGAEIFAYFGTEKLTAVCLSTDNGVATFRASDVGAKYNLSSWAFEIPRPELSSITFGESIIPGTDEETDDDFRARLILQFDGANYWHSDAKYRQILSTKTGVHAQNIYFDKQARGAGTCDIYILFDDATVGTTYTNEIQAWLYDKGFHGHGDDVQIKAMPAQIVNPTFTLVFFENATDKTGTISKVVDAIKCAFRENHIYDESMTKTSAGNTFYVSNLIHELISLFPEIKGIKTTQGDIVTAFKVARLGTLVVQEYSANV